MQVACSLPVTWTLSVRTLRVRLLILVGAGAWLYFIGLSLSHIASTATEAVPPRWWLYDWHVHWAGALDLVGRELYRGPLLLPGLPLPTPVFNLPPAAPAIAVPLLPLGREVAGIAWLVAGVGALSGAAYAAGRITGISWAVVGLLLVAYTGVPFFSGHIVLGNVNHLMLAIVVGFCWAYLNGHERTAGVLLGAAVAVKVWPVAIAVLLIRERRWAVLQWAVGFVAVQGVVFLLWLSPDVLPDMIAALRTEITPRGDPLVIWTAWARYEWGVPAWTGPALAVIALAIPARGRLGLGLAMIAGLSLIDNVWSHYLPTFAVAALLIGSGLVRPSRCSARRGLGSPTLRRGCSSSSGSAER
jgi:hypothetical protein